jgi:hypothetical protein
MSESKMYESREEWIARTDRLREVERLEFEAGNRRPSHLMPKIISTPLSSQKVKPRGIHQNTPSHDKADQRNVLHKKEKL